MLLRAEFFHMTEVQIVINSSSNDTKNILFMQTRFLAPRQCKNGLYNCHMNQVSTMFKGAKKLQLCKTTKWCYKIGIKLHTYEE